MSNPDAIDDGRPGGNAAAVREIRDIALSSRQPTDVSYSAQAHLIPDGHHLVVVDDRSPEEHGEHPERRRGQASFVELDPFVRYVNRHRDDEATTVWVSHELGTIGSGDRPVGAILAVIDDHEPAEAGWGEHRAHLPLVTTPEWRHWMSRDSSLSDQLAFAEHLEDGAVEIVRPDAAEMLDVAQSIQVTRGVDFGSAQRTRDGQIQVAYKEEQEAKAGRRGELTIPETFELRIAVFPGTDPVEVQARLRWRLSDGTLRIGYRLVRPHEALTRALAGVRAKLVADLDDVLADRVYEGAPISNNRALPKHETTVRTAR